MLYTASIQQPRQETDGTRISVMSRHTKNDGVTPNPDITPDLFDEHLTDFAPPPELIGAYYKRGLPWEDFANRYTDYIRSIGGTVLELANRALEENVTLLCIEDTPEQCHRRLLAEECQLLVPELIVIIR
jgi:uncharacterized protein YeaO (DUF488 family)